MVALEVSAHFPAPPADVWRVYTDHAGWTGWAGIGKVRLEREGTPERDGVGAVRAIENFGLVVREEVTHFEPPRLMRYRVASGVPLRHHEGEVELLPDGDGTRLVWRCRFDVPIPGAGPFVRVGVAALFRLMLRRLARRRFR
ncbi:MAG: SRPBCC family protein [Polyangiaceae bacterium]|nr:SRPBCC family protein [Polyangiaceae bacterium]